jgi:hypothetical protein
MQHKMGLWQSTAARKVNPLSLTIIYFNIPAFTSGLY